MGRNCVWICVVVVVHSLGEAVTKMRALALDVPRHCESGGRRQLSVEEREGGGWGSR